MPYYAEDKEIAAAGRPLILAALRSDPPPDCVVTAHERPRPSFDVTEDGRVWCGECQP